MTLPLPAPSVPLPPVIVIAGPTASGKSALALDLAERLGGCVINADSMQVYSELHMLSARPSAHDISLVPHRLYGILSGHDICSAERWARMAAAEITDAIAHGLLPIVVGGTGLYLRALMEGLSPMPDIPEPVRTQARALLAEVGNERFHALLAEKDPEVAASLKVGDSQRLARAYEVITASGKSIRHWQSVPPEKVISARFFTLVLKPERQALYDAINRRFDVMIEYGALQEVRDLLATQAPADAPVMKALGVPELAAYLHGECSLPDAVDRAKQGTRNYAKRQMTWFRRNIISNHDINSQYVESLRHENFAIVRHFLLTTAP
jgi:tRNA dimethylallyltransferase